MEPLILVVIGSTAWKASVAVASTLAALFIENRLLAVGFGLVAGASLYFSLRALA